MGMTDFYHPRLKLTLLYGFGLDEVGGNYLERSYDEENGEEKSCSYFYRPIAFATRSCPSLMLSCGISRYAIVVLISL